MRVLRTLRRWWPRSRWAWAWGLSLGVHGLALWGGWGAGGVAPSPPVAPAVGAMQAWLVPEPVPSARSAVLASEGGPSRGRVPPMPRPVAPSRAVTAAASADPPRAAEAPAPAPASGAASTPALAGGATGTVTAGTPLWNAEALERAWRAERHWQQRQRPVADLGERSWRAPQAPSASGGVVSIQEHTGADGVRQAEVRVGSQRYCLRGPSLEQARWQGPMPAQAVPMNCP